jgi:cystatin-C
MRKLNLLLPLFVFCLIAIAAQTAKAQIAGGYGPVDTKDPQVRAAARYAVAVENKKIKSGVIFRLLVKAEQQVVAGMNYKVCLKVKNGKRIRYATAVVYRDLKGKRSLTSWEWGECNW